ncbi:MAG: methyltransferase domain-containing protein, partial [bacterium]|nr:methyltransferase domain-containing protein [bacterium]
RLPFKPESFDYVYSIGVLHHLPDPKEGFLKLVSLVKSGGSMSVWVYGYEGNALVRYTVEPIRKYVTSRMPQGLLLAVAWLITIPAFAVAKFVYRPISVAVPKFYAKLPMAAYIKMWFEFPFKEIWNIIYDQLVTPITHYISRDDITDWLKTANITSHQVTQRMGMSWRIFLTKS